MNWPEAIACMAGPLAIMVIVGLAMILDYKRNRRGGAS